MFISILGPTGCGKTAFVLALAKKLPIEVVNADIGQMYSPFSVGVALPTKEEQDACPHHLFSFLSEPKDYSIVAYRAQVEDLYKKILSRQRIPVFVGGSTFYQQSLFFKPVEISTVSIDAKRQFQDIETSSLWQQLLQIDSERAAAIHPNDRYRIERALFIWLATGKKPSEQGLIFSPLDSNGMVVFLSRQRADLYARINARTADMLELGWTEEIMGLADNWLEFAKTKGFIGYEELSNFLLTNDSLKTPPPEIIKKIQQKTRQYAKRQEVFFKRFLSLLAKFNWSQSMICDLTLSDHHLYIEQIVESCLLLRP